MKPLTKLQQLKPLLISIIAMGLIYYIYAEMMIR